MPSFKYKILVKNYHESVKINHSPNWSYFNILIFGRSGVSKTNVFLNLMKNQPPYIDKISLYIEDPFK